MKLVKLIICAYFFCSNAFAVDLELTEGTNAAIPVAIEPFIGENSNINLSDTISADLAWTKQFKILNGDNASHSFLFWKQKGADSFIKGTVVNVGANNYKVECQLIDSASNGKVLLTQTYTVPAGQLRALAHHIADLVYQKLTGEPGIFSTRIAYIQVQRSSNGTRYTLEVSEVDGSNPQNLLISSEPIMSPTWSPDGQKIAYVSFEKKRAQIFVVEVATGQRRLLTSFEGINGAPSWSPDGRKLAVVLSKTGSPKLYLIDMQNASLSQLTFGDAIDTEPSFSPDGSSILFTSGRGGSPQIYRYKLGSGQITRVTYDGNYNAGAAYTPNQKSIVMMHRDKQEFNLSIQDVASGIMTPLTSSPYDESPSIAPNGRFIVYATKVNGQGALAVVSTDGRARFTWPLRTGDLQDPSWSPYY